MLKRIRALQRRHPFILLYVDTILILLSRFAEKMNRLIPVKLRADVVESHMPQIVNCSADGVR